MPNKLPAPQPVSIRVDSCIAHQIDEKGPTGKQVTVYRGDEFLQLEAESGGQAQIRDPHQKAEYPCLLVRAEDIEPIERISAAPHAVAI